MFKARKKCKLDCHWTLSPLKCLIIYMWYMWLYKQHHNMYLKAMLELIEWAPRRAQISFHLCYSQVGLWEFNSRYFILHNEYSDLTETFFNVISSMDCYAASKLLVKMIDPYLSKQCQNSQSIMSVKSNYCYFH